MGNEILTASIALIAVLSYTLYAKYYEKVVREIDEALISATILYGLASMILITGSLITSPFNDKEFNVPNSFFLWGEQFENSWVLVGTIAMMSIGYYVHIVTEAYSRKRLNMGIYSIFFQSNILIIIGLDWTFHDSKLRLISITGGIIVFVASIWALRKKELDKGTKKDKNVVIIACLSALTCGGSLFIDGEVGRYLIFKDDFNISQISTFLFYEFLTFFIPFLLTISHLMIKLGFKKALKSLNKGFSSYKILYLLSSLFSVGQFVFSVFALSSNTKFFGAIILGTTPFVNVIFDTNFKPKTQYIQEIILAICMLIGLGMIFYNK
jgi:drug/metabolite transporter (DMT)-like permease